ncbi:unnamed protein product [Rangifer tarandus platyrhynchus]|uniref:Secreted protein n=1 Tax=Rangifer tarandus platyrhynchus TaxID=3082113 RepID=A0ABN8Y1B9_RANTA|nr:unnamed protein product [Rangifer tarandus platyrhynchus]
MWMGSILPGPWVLWLVKVQFVNTTNLLFCDCRKLSEHQALAARSQARARHARCPELRGLRPPGSNGDDAQATSLIRPPGSALTGCRVPAGCGSFGSDIGVPAPSTARPAIPSAPAAAILEQAETKS